MSSSDGVEMMIIILATFAQTLIPRVNEASTMVTVLSVFRFIAGNVLCLLSNY